MKVIEIKGIGIPNKGAELMLHSVLQHFESKHPGMFVVEPNTGYVGRARYGLWQKTSFEVRGRAVDASWIFRLIPRTLRRKFGLVLDSEINTIIDASGFAYGDQWGARKARERLGKRLRKWKAAGKKVILLPQAFGPFTSDAIRSEMATVLEHADLVFARDNQSFSHLEKVSPGKAFKSPDFTNLVKVPSYIGREAFAGRPCVIPNSKMIQMGRISEEAYVVGLTEAVQVLLENGINPFLLLHEGAADLRLAELVNQKLGNALEILRTDDALEIKYVIGKCSIVISSRFHGLVSALSQGIPVVAMGWSHKYEELLADYGSADLLADPQVPGSIADKVRLLLQPGQIEKATEIIEGHVDTQKSLVAEMWQRVDATLA